MSLETLPTATTAQPSKQSANWHRSRSTVLIWIGRVLVVAVVLVLWQAFAGGPKSALPSDVVSRPSAFAGAFWTLLKGGGIFPPTGQTALSALYSLLIAIPVAAVAAAITATRLGRWVFEPIVTITYAVPKVGLISLLVIIDGISRTTDVILVTSAVIFVYYFAFRQAADELDRSRVIAFRLMGANRLRIFRSLMIGYAIPQLIAASRIAIPLAFATEIFAELRVPGTPGLGVELTSLIDNFKSASSVGVMLLILVLGYLLDLLLRGLLSWYTKSIGVGTEL
jgi:taurine transport system permease protein